MLVKAAMIAGKDGSNARVSLIIEACLELF